MAGSLPATAPWRRATIVIRPMPCWGSMRPRRSTVLALLRIHHGALPRADPYQRAQSRHHRIRVALLPRRYRARHRRGADARQCLAVHPVPPIRRPPALIGGAAFDTTCSWLTRRPAAPGFRLSSPPSSRRGRRRPARAPREHLGAQERGTPPFLRVVELTDDTEDRAVWGRTSGLIRRLQADRGPGAYALRRQRCHAAHAHKGGSALDRGAIEARGGSRLKTMWAGYAFSRTSARSVATPTCSRTRPSPSGSRPSSSRARASTTMAPCTYRTRSSAPAISSRIREDEPAAFWRGAQARVPPGQVHRLPRPGHDASCG
jgi:hypothetical protein